MNIMAHLTQSNPVRLGFGSGCLTESLIGMVRTGPLIVRLDSDTGSHISHELVDSRSRSIPSVPVSQGYLFSGREWIHGFTSRKSLAALPLTKPCSRLRS